MSEFVISTRYANAFMGIAEKNNLFPQIIAEVKFISKTLSNSKELRNLLVNPTINSQKKITILNEIFNSHISKELSDFLKFLVVKKRENLLRIFLLIASLYFYMVWNINFIFLLLISIIVDYFIAIEIQKTK